MKNFKKRKLRKINFLLRKSRRTLKRRQRCNRKKRHRKRANEIVYSKLMRFLVERDFIKKEKNPKIRIANIVIPKRFSFSENPNDTIKVLKKLLYYGQQSSIDQINFDHSKCEELGICASTVMDVILLEIQDLKKRLRKSFGFSGQLPDKEKIRDILEASGIISHLDFDVQEKKHIEKLELKAGDNRNEDQSSSVATQITDYFVRCLNKQSLTLSREGRWKMGEMVGEVIDNCQQHAGNFTKWYTLGHYHQFAQENKNYGECHLVIFNFGDTIYENLKLSGSEQLLNSLKNLTRKHKNFFGKNWKEESLWTLYALQEGVSRLDKIKEPDRGTGTMKFINHFQEIGKTMGGELPVMSITSGRAHIYFDNKYMMKRNDNEDRCVIAFNTSNDLSNPPNSKNVKMLNEYFPGTVISLKFYLDKKYIQKKIESEGM